MEYKRESAGLSSQAAAEQADGTRKLVKPLGGDLHEICSSFILS
jgi:hypothetical protein